MIELESATKKRDQYFDTLYSEITIWAKREKMIQIVSFLPQRISRWGRDMAIDLEKGEIWGRENLTFGLALGRWHDRVKLQFGGYPSGPDSLMHELNPRLLDGMVNVHTWGSWMYGEFKSDHPETAVEVNCWANDHVFGGDRLDGQNPYALVDIVDRTIRQGR